MIDLRSPWPERGTRRLPAGEIASLATEYPGEDDARETTTDLVLIPQARRAV